jgi:hypothetical protein
MGERPIVAVDNRGTDQPQIQLRLKPDRRQRALGGNRRSTDARSEAKLLMLLEAFALTVPGSMMPSSFWTALSAGDERVSRHDAPHQHQP